MTRAFALALVCAAALALGAAAEGPDAPPPKGQIATAAWFPKLGATAATAMPAGEVVTVVVAARNEGKEPYTLAAVAGAVHTADFKHRVQNFSRTLIGDELAPGQEMSVEYAFYLDPVLAGREYGVAIALLYNQKKEGGDAAASLGKTMMSVAFNGTVDVTEPPRLVDTEALFMFAVLIGLALVAAYFAYAAAAERFGLPAPGVLLAGAQGAAAGGGKGAGGAGGGAGAAAARKRAAAAAKKSADDDDEWVKGTSYDLAKRKRQQGATARVRAAAE